MTQTERDAAIRTLRDRLALAKENRVAVLTELRTSADACRDVGQLCATILKDASLHRVDHVLPAAWPTTERLRYLFSELRAADEAIEECQRLLREAGF